MWTEQLRDELIDTTAKAATTVYYTKAVTAILGASVNPFVPMAVYTTASYIITCTREIIRNAKLNTEEYERLTAILEESTRATKEAHAEFAKHVAQCEERQRSMLGLHLLWMSNVCVGCMRNLFLSITVSIFLSCQSVPLRYLGLWTTESERCCR